MRTWAEAAYRNRGLLLTIPYLFMILYVYGETENDFLIWSSGLFIFLAGYGLRVWSRSHHPYRVPLRTGPTTTGPYAHVRNPIYLANTTMLAGVAVLSELVWFVPFVLVWCMVVYSFVVRREEAHLSSKFGGLYDEYFKAVPRWIPHLHRYSVEGRTTNRVPWVNSFALETHCLLLCVPLIGKELLWDGWYLGLWSI